MHSSVLLFALLNVSMNSEPLMDPSSPAATAFAQGVSFLHGFNEPAALDSFSRALVEDPNCAVCAWGAAAALVQGNYSGATAGWLQAAELQRRAMRLSPLPETRPIARDLIAAYNTLFRSPVSSMISDVMFRKQRAASPVVVDAIRDVVDRWNSPEAACLFAHVLLFMHAGCHDPSGRLDDDAEVVLLLERMVQDFPDHPGLNHYHIHARERTPHPERALPSAIALPRLAPDLGHLVHMPSHIYLRIGDFAASVEANKQAIATDERYFAEQPELTSYYDFFHLHNIHMLWAANLLMPDLSASLAASDLMKVRIRPQNIAPYPYLAQQYAAIPMLTLVRFRQWDAIDALLPGDVELSGYVGSISALGKGLAAAAHYDVIGAREAVHQLRWLLGNPDEAPDRTLRTLQGIALSLGEATLAALKRGHRAQAQHWYLRAIAEEDQLAYGEPWPWQLPIREYYAQFLIDQGNFADAVAVCDAELKRHPNNPYALSLRQVAQGNGHVARK